MKEINIYQTYKFVKDEFPNHFHRFQESSGRIWFYTDGDHIYTGFAYNTGSRGFGGRKIIFKWTGGQETLYGPWHSNANSLFMSTGIDLINQYRTRGVIALVREYDPRMGYTYKQVLHFEPDFILGRFDRIEDLADYHFQREKKTVYYHTESIGGTVDSFIGDPNA
jgi:hypothetical protein